MVNPSSAISEANPQQIETMTQVVLILVYHIGYFILLELNKKFAKENVKTSSKYG